VKQGDEQLKKKKYHLALDKYSQALDTLNQEMRGPENDKEAAVFLKYRYYVIDSMRECYDMMNEYESALKMCNQFFELEKQLRKLRVLDQWEESLNFLSAKKAEYLIVLKQLKEAMIVLRELVDTRLAPLHKSDPKNEKTRKQLAFCLTQQGKIYAHWSEYEKAIGALDKALKIAPHHSEALSFKCLCLLRLNLVDEAQAVAKSVMDRHLMSSADYRCRVLYIESLLKKKEWDDCINVCTATLKLYLEDQLPLLYRAQAYLSKHEFKKALEDVVQFEKIHGIHMVPVFNLDSSVIYAKSLLSLCKFKSAAKMLEERLKAVDLNKQAGEDHIYPLLVIQGIVYQQLNKFAESKHVFEEYVLPRLDSLYFQKPEFIIQTRNAFARTLLKSGESTEAISFMNKSTRLVESLISDGTISKNRDAAMAIDEYYGLRAEISASMGDRAQVIEMLDQLAHVLKVANVETEEGSDYLIHGQIAQGMCACYAEQHDKALEILVPLLDKIAATDRAYSARELKAIIQECRTRITPPIAANDTE